MKRAAQWASEPEAKRPKQVPYRGQSVTSKLMMRELSRTSNNTCAVDNSMGRFKGFKPRNCFDACDLSSTDVKLCFLRKRSKVVEICSTQDLIFTLTQTGICTALDRSTAKRVCFLNITPDEVIRSLFYNKSNQSVITVSVYRDDNYSSLRCRSTPLEYIRGNKPENGFQLFESESLRWPGFVEFDDVNGKVLTYSAKDHVYKIWDLVNYTTLYSVPDANIQEIKISPGIMLLIHNRSECKSFVKLKIVAIDTGECLKTFEHALKPCKKIEFIEQFNEKLLVKQEEETLQIVDVRNFDVLQVPCTDFMTPSAFIFLYQNQLFLTFRDHKVAVWNFKGELVTQFEDHVLWHPDCNTNNIYITSGQDLIISYCKSKYGNTGSINVSDIMTGKCLAKIANEEMLHDITSLFYNEDLNEIYIGNKNGTIHTWAN